MTLVETNAPEKLAALNEVLGVYALYTKRTPTEVVQVKMGQLLLGTGTGEANQPGLFGLLAATAPQRGRVTSERRAAGYRLGRATSTSVQWARERAGQLLGGRPTGAFQIRTGSAGGGEYLTGVAAGQISTRGRSQGRIKFGGRKFKYGADLVTRGVGRAVVAAAGGVILNRQALTVVLAIARREKSRQATAVQVLPSRYRTILRRQPGRRYRGNQAVGVSSTDLAQTHRHARELVVNRKGRALGELTLDAAPGSSRIRLQGHLGLFAAAQQTGLAAAIERVTADTLQYVLDKQTFGAAALLRRAGARVSAA